MKSSVIFEQNLKNFCCRFFKLKFLNASSSPLKIFRISMTVRLRRWYSLGPRLKKPRDAGPNPKRCHYPQTLLHMVQHVAGWVAPFCRGQHSYHPPFKFFTSIPLLHFFTCTKVWGNYHYHAQIFTFKNIDNKRSKLKNIVLFLFDQRLK